MHAILLLSVTTLYVFNCVMHYWTMQVIPVLHTKLLPSSVWDVIWELGMYDHVKSDSVVIQHLFVYALCVTCVYLYGCVTTVCGYVSVRVWMANMIIRQVHPLLSLRLLPKQPFYSVNHDVYLFPISTSCYELNKNEEVETLTYCMLWLCCLSFTHWLLVSLSVFPHTATFCSCLTTTFLSSAVSKPLSIGVVNNKT